MFGLDDRIASLSTGASIWIVVGVAILLGLRHATDPDHLAAVTTLIASGRERAARQAGALGFFWGVGHATTLFAFGLPVVLFGKHLPLPVQQAAESAVAVVIVILAVRLLVRWRRGDFHVHQHRHDDVEHVHLHGHERAAGHTHAHVVRTPLGAFGIGLVHGLGGSAGVSVLLLASVRSTALAVVSLALLALFTAVSMTILTTGFGFALFSRPVRSTFNRIAPVLGFASLAFGVWYGLGALDLAPSVF